MIEAELGASIESLFCSISPQPVAAASLGQVYRAVLRGSMDQPERVVAIKVGADAAHERLQQGNAVLTCCYFAGAGMQCIN